MLSHLAVNESKSDSLLLISPKIREIIRETPKILIEIKESLSTKEFDALSKRINLSVEEEAKILKRLVKEVDVPISVDTYKPKVAEACFKVGAHMLNDITGVKNEDMIPIIKKYNVPVNVMHMKGIPEDMQENPYYDDL